MKRAGTSKGSATKDVSGMEAAARVLAAGGRVPKKFAKARPVSAGPTREAQAAQTKVTPARRAAFEILSLVEQGKGHSDDLLRGMRTEELSEADKHLCTALVMGVLRWQIALDAQLQTMLDRPGQKIAEPVMLALRFGAFQLLHMDRIPAHAALSESVELCRAGGHSHATGMVNAILRKVAARAKDEAGTNAPPRQPIFETTAAFAERLAHPAWLVERWANAYGRDNAMKICQADQAEPERGRLFSAEENLPEIDDGSRLVAELAAAALPQVEGRAAKVWDTCAAPGGKTLILAARLPHAEVLATDVSAKRLAQTQGRMRRYPYAANVKTVAVAAEKLPEAAGSFDLILCDMPCSGTGTLGRNPEIRLRLQPSELKRQSLRQQEILAAAWERLAPGGRLVYSTCSLEEEENEAVVSSTCVASRKVDVLKLLHSLAGLQSVDTSMILEDALRTLPGVHACDGFYAVVLERSKEE